MLNKKGQSTGMVVLIAFIAILVIGVMWVAGTYNSLVGVDTTVEKSWGNVQTAYQRRADLIPNLVETVKGARDFEKSTLTEIAALRSQAGQAKINIDNAKVGDTTALEGAGTEMNSALSRLLVIVENYPDLKSNQNFLSLQDEIAGTENRIKYERDNYNSVVQSYKYKVRAFPSNILAGMFGFELNKWTMFQADKGAENAPKVDFS